MKYHIKTFGCQMNVSDSERIAGFLEMKKIKPASSIEKADLVVFNTCGVRQTAENSAMGQIHNLRKKNTKIIITLTGCLADRGDVKEKLKNKVNLFFPIKDFSKFENYLIENLKLKNLQQHNQKNSTSYLSTKPKYGKISTAYVPIMTGCDNFCSYCVVPYARGREISRSPKDIFKEIADLEKNGYKEITLLGQNVNSYSYNLSFPQRRESSAKMKFNDWIPAFAGMTKVSFPALLNYLAKYYEKIKFKFLTSHPKDFSDELIETIAQNKNISRQIHLPIQSGSNKILKKMNRPYTQKYYLNLIEKIKKIIPKAEISTDVIVGFPGETKKDFQETAKVFKKVSFFLAYINKYSPRPGTKAFSLKDDVSWSEKKERERALKDLVKKV